MRWALAKITAEGKPRGSRCPAQCTVAMTFVSAESVFGFRLPATDWSSQDESPVSRPVSPDPGLI